MTGDDGNPGGRTTERMEADLRAALDRLRRGEPEDPQNRKRMARTGKGTGRPLLNVRMLCRESRLSPTTMYRRFPWAVALLGEWGIAADAEPSKPSCEELVQQLNSELKASRRVIGTLQAEVHQLAQAVIALNERAGAAEQARQAAVDAGRRRKEAAYENVTSLRR